MVDQVLYAIAKSEDYPFYFVMEIESIIDHLTFIPKGNKGTAWRYIQIVPEAEALQIKQCMEMKKEFYDQEFKRLKDQSFESVKETCDVWQIPYHPYIKSWAAKYYNKP